MEEQRSMGKIFGVPLAPKKTSWPKSEKKRALLRYQLKAAGEYKRAMQRRDGSSGAASPVRKIDPVTGEVIEVIPAK
jgi:hypothetical protein